MDSLSMPVARECTDLKDYSEDLRRCITQLKKVLPHTDERHSVATSTHSSASKTKLPPVSLPTFNGNFLEWPSFLKRFQDILSKFQS